MTETNQLNALLQMLQASERIAKQGRLARSVTGEEIVKHVACARVATLRLRAEMTLGLLDGASVEDEVED